MQYTAVRFVFHGDFLELRFCLPDASALIYLNDLHFTQAGFLKPVIHQDRFARAGIGQLVRVRLPVAGKLGNVATLHNLFYGVRFRFRRRFRFSGRLRRRWGLFRRGGH